MTHDARRMVELCLILGKKMTKNGKW